MKPVWFLDIDGVINSWPTPPEESPWEFQKKYINGYPIWWANEVVEFINATHSDRAEIQWLTTWETDANVHFAPGVGITHRFEVQPRTYEGWDRWWKAERMQMFREANPDTPIIWTDDEIYDYLEVRSVKALVGENALVINPWHYMGLTSESLKMIDEFIDSRQEGAENEVDQVASS